MNALVTGGLQGIGRAIVENLQARGDTVFVFDIVSSEDERVTILQNTGVRYFSVDISCVDAIENGFSQLYKVLENKNLDILVNNAGVTCDTLVLRMKEQDWDAVLDVNLKGMCFCCKCAIKKMIRQKKSYIINMSSIVGKIGNIGQANYAASKAGVIALTKSLSVEYGSRNVLVNAIAPGFIQTDMTAKLPGTVKDEILKRISLKRFGQPGDVANLVAFLTSGDADYITGAVLDLNGGMT
jgi:3-oxoacyl-[acyl-carrier protein] reductase